MLGSGRVVQGVRFVLQVDDTVSGVGEALEAGCWGVGVARYSNYMDVDSLEQEDQISPEVSHVVRQCRCKMQDILFVILCVLIRC